MKHFKKILASFLILATLVVFIPHDTARAATALDNSAQLVDPNGPGANTFPYTMGTVSNGLLVLVFLNGFVTSVTYAGSNMTFLATNSGYSYYYTINPPSGTNNIVITRSNGLTSVSDDGYVESFSGAKQTGTPLVGFQQNTGSSVSGETNNFITSTAGSYVFDLVQTDGSPVAGGSIPSITATGTGHVLVGYQYSGGGESEGNGGGYTPAATAGTYSIGYNWAGVTMAASWLAQYYEVLAAPPPASPAPTNLIQGANAVIRGGNVTFK